MFEIKTIGHLHSAAAAATHQPILPNYSISLKVNFVVGDGVVLPCLCDSNHKGTIMSKDESHFVYILEQAPAIKLISQFDFGLARSCLFCSAPWLSVLSVDPGFTATSPLSTILRAAMEFA